jgi:hypothetical protein
VIEVRGLLGILCRCRWGCFIFDGPRFLPSSSYEILGEDPVFSEIILPGVRVAQ